MSTAAPFFEKLTQSSPQVQPKAPWHVVVMNDPVNLMSYVVMVFQKVFGYDLAKAKSHMLEVHEEGQTVVWSGQQEQAEHYVYVLQQWQLTTKLMVDSL